MINFFRRIRHKLIQESQFFKYLKYAIGEIVLVVVGILIALQINNWNEQRKSDDRRKAMFTQVRTELVHNIKRANKVIDGYLPYDSINYRVLKRMATPIDYNSDDRYKYMMFNYGRAVVEDDSFQSLLRSESSFTHEQDSLIVQLKQLYGASKREVDDYDNHTMNLLREFENKLKSDKFWYSTFMVQKMSDEAIQYFLNDPIYLNHVKEMVGARFNLHLEKILGFRQSAISIYEAISEHIELKKDTTIINKFENVEALVGTYELNQPDSIFKNETFMREFDVVEDNGLKFKLHLDSLEFVGPLYPYSNNYLITTFDNSGVTHGWISKIQFDKNNKVKSIVSIGRYGLESDLRPKYIKVD